MGNRPVMSGKGASYEIRAPIATDAYHIEFGVQFDGEIWIHQIPMEFESALEK
jgi:hypothetical protein